MTDRCYCLESVVVAETHGPDGERSATMSEQFDAHIRAEIAKFRKIVQDAKIKVE